MPKNSGANLNTVYKTREERHEFIAVNFMAFLRGSVLNIGGGGERQLLNYISPEKYFELDINGRPDLLVDLDETYPLPLPDNSFDAVLCTDVLEHLEHLHRVFEELIRVSRRYVILSLPNSLRSTSRYLRGELYQHQDQFQCPGFNYGLYSKYYGLPFLRPSDRHRWYFSYTEAESFVRYHQHDHGYKVLREFPLGIVGETLQGKFIRRLANLFLSRRVFMDLFAGTYWCVLEKISD